jgi:hypothetical protein
MAYEHLTYLDLDSTQIQDAIPLETAGNSLTDYFMIPVTDLPLLDPLRLIPVVGNPLADLLQPDMTVLVNLGYGSITDGWSQGPANVATPFDLFPTDLNWSDVLTALVNGVPQGVQAAIADLEKSGELPNHVAAGQLDVDTARGCGVHVRAHRPPGSRRRSS